MEQKEKDVYVPPRVTMQRVRLEQGMAVPTSVIIADDSITQEDDWGTEDPTGGETGGMWMSFY